MIFDNFLLLLFAFGAGFWFCIGLTQYTIGEGVFDKWKRGMNWIIFLVIFTLAILQALEVM